MLANSVAILLLATAASALASQIPRHIYNQAGVWSHRAVLQTRITLEEQIFTNNDLEIWRAVYDDPNIRLSRRVVLKCVSAHRLFVNLDREFHFHHVAHQHTRNVLPVYDIISNETDANHIKRCLVTGYARNGNVNSLMVKAASPMPEPLVKVLVYHIALALEALHRNHLVHRDIRPKNIVMMDNGSFKLSNFHDAAYVDYTFRLQPLQANFGTPGFIAPEYGPFEPGSGPHYSIVEQRPMDIYALGMTIKNLLTHRPVQTELTELTTELSKSAYQLIKFMTWKNPVERYTIQHVLNDPWLKSAVNHISHDDDLAMHEMKKMAANHGYEWDKIEAWLKAAGFAQ